MWTVITFIFFVLVMYTKFDADRERLDLLEAQVEALQQESKP